MSNLESARTAIEAELLHAKEGFAFYRSRIEALQKMLSQLDSVNGAPVAGRRGRKPGALKQRPVATQKARRFAGNGHKLPFTGGNYWADLISEKPQSVSDILGAAVSKLEFTPSEEQVKKLAGRMTFALNALVKTRKIQDSGSGRERRFFRK
ncbi:MAG: hypothetical protein JO269_05040 [Burkholderiaceae bacterium]|nr:hypothetical protein [Burkholderiaceae bacterium]